MPPQTNCQGFICEANDGFEKIVALYNLSRRRIPSPDGKHKRITNCVILMEKNIKPHVDFIRFRTTKIIKEL